MCRANPYHIALTMEAKMRQRRRKVQKYEGGGTTNRFLLLFSLLYLQTLGGGHDPTGPSASGPPKVKMISEYKRILWQATSSLIIDLSSLAYFFTLAFFFAISDRNFVCYIVHGYIDALLQCLSLRFDKN